MSNTKQRVLVIYGGRSGEHEVSLHSAASVVRNLDRDRFEIRAIGIDKEGLWHSIDPSLIEASLKNPELPLPVDSPQVVLPPGSDSHQVELVGVGNSARISNVDVVFPVMHGPLCEDGSIQGLFELAGVAYVGAGVLGSAVGMDKDVAKRLVLQAGLPTGPYLCYRQFEWARDREKILAEVTEKLPYPVFVKPANLGSSVGITKVANAAALAAAVDLAFRYDRKVLIEQGIDGREIEVSVLENIQADQGPLTSVAGEITPTHDFYSYEAKYLDEKGASLHIPAKISDEQMREVRRLAAEIFTVLECEGMARIDFFLERNTGRFYFNEINTLPGFTTISMYPKLWEASGISYSELLSRLIDLAIRRHRAKLALTRDYKQIS